MQQSLKERLIGGVIIITAIILVLPSLLNDSPPEPNFKVPQLPNMPEGLVILSKQERVAPLLQEERITYEAVALDIQQQKIDYAALENKRSDPEEPVDNLVDEADLDRLVSRVQASEPKIAPVELTTLAPLKENEQLMADPERSDGVKPVWTVQVASFKAAENADKLNAELLLKGYRAYRASLAGVDGVARHRVFVGPDLLKSQAQSVADTVNRTFGVESIVVRYAP